MALVLQLPLEYYSFSLVLCTTLALFCRQLRAAMSSTKLVEETTLLQSYHRYVKNNNYVLMMCVNFSRTILVLNWVTSNVHMIIYPQFSRDSERYSTNFMSLSACNIREQFGQRALFCCMQPSLILMGHDNVMKSILVWFYPFVALHEKREHLLAHKNNSKVYGVTSHVYVTDHTTQKFCTVCLSVMVHF